MGSISRQLLFFSALLVVSASLIVALYWATASQRWLVESRLTAVEETAIKGEAEISAYIRSLSANVLFLANHEPVRGLVHATLSGGVDPLDNSSSAQWRIMLERNFIDLLEVNSDLFQVRLIGVADGGREIARVERIGDRIAATPKEKLQQKGNRGYFKETVQLPDRSIYYSELDLNVEFGRPSLPYTPTLRVASPVYSESGDLFGLVIVNANVNPLMKRYERALNPGGQSVYVLGGNDQFLVHPDGSKRFAKDLGGRFGIAEQFPLLAGEIANWLSQDGSSVKSFDRPDSMLTVVKTPLGEAFGHYLLGIIETPKSLLDAEVKSGLTPALLITLLLTMAGLIPAVLLARIISRPIEKLSNAANRLAEGEWSDELAADLPTGRQDELGRLSRAFLEIESKLEKRETETDE